MSRKLQDPPVVEVDIHAASDDQLMEMSQEMGLSLSLDEMKTVREYFANEGRSPTDIELQSIGQAWSEHCCYKSSRVHLKEFVFAIDHPDVLARGDAGVMAFDDDYAYALRLESHNHPSAIEPYGGAATGIGGILRDVVCMGAQPIALVDPLCFGPIDSDAELPPGAKHPRYLMDGVVSGIRDYGNRVGVPTVSGAFFFDDRYTGNCLVNVGCLGIVKRSEVCNNFVGGPGEVLILCGGRTGRDGIHGVTFASVELKESSEEESRGSVQLGDPITKEPLMHACLEVNRLGLITGMKDLGGGGLSCVVGEMALDADCGAVMHLDRVPLKEEGLAPWEIWVSESQERMMMATTEDKVEAILDVFRTWDVLATVVATTVAEKRTSIMWGEEKIFEMDLQFLTGGPEYCRPYEITIPQGEAGEVVPELPANEKVLLGLLSDPNVASKEWAIRQYDHDVRAATVLRPLVGDPNDTGPGDAAVLRPLHDSWRGLATAVGCNPWFTALDPYRGGMSAVDETCRNLVAVGARPHSLTDCLNFGNPEKPDRLGQFREAVRGLGEAASHLELPIPSGNVSLYNESPKGGALPTPMIMGVGIVEDVRKCVSSDLKEAGNPVYVVGETLREMGGSLLYRLHGGEGGDVPSVDLEALKMKMDLLLKAMSKDMVRSCHDCSDGGMAVALAEMCIGGSMGASVQLKGLGDLQPSELLFSESNGRWIVEVCSDHEEDWVALMGVHAQFIGVAGGPSLMIHGGGIDVPLEKLKKAWNEPIWNLLG